MKKNVLFVVDEKMVGGVSTLLEDMLNMLDISDFNIDVLVLHNNGDSLNNLPKEVNVLYGTKYFSSIDLSLKEILYKKSFRLLFNKIKIVFGMKTGCILNRIKLERKKILNNKYDVEIAFKDGFSALFTACGDSLYKIHWLHSDYSIYDPTKKYTSLFRKLLNKFNKIVAVSEKVEASFNNIYHFEDKTQVIYNLISIKRIKDKLLDTPKILVDNRLFNMVSLGRIHSLKGYDRLIDVFDKLNKNHFLTGTKLYIYGDGPDFNLCKRKIEELNLSHFISMEGRIDNPYCNIKENDLFILPSRTESFGLVILESLICGVPVLTTKNSVEDKIIKEKETGLIVENSFDGLYNGLKYVITNKKEIYEYKKNLKSYTYDNKKILDVIERLIQGDKNEK